MKKGKIVKKCKQRFWIFLACIILCEINVTSVEAKNLNTQVISEQTEVELYAKKVAMDWAKTIRPELNLWGGNVQQVVVKDSNILEYTVSYYKGLEAYGYAVVVENNKDFVVKEAVIQRGVEGFYTDLVDGAEINSKKENLKIDKKIIELEPLHYGVVATDKKKRKQYVYDNYKNKIGSKKIVKTASNAKYASPGAIYINKNKWYSGEYIAGSSEKNWIILKKWLTRPSLWAEEDIEAITGKYACGIQATTQIAQMEGFCNGEHPSIRSTYNRLWDLTGTETLYKKME